MDYSKRFFALFFLISIMFNTHNTYTIDIKKYWHATSNFLYNTFTAKSVPEHLAAKRKSQLATALQLFTERDKNNISLSNSNTSTINATTKQLCSQTKAYIGRFKKEIDTQWQIHLKDNDALIKKILTREEEYAATHYVFYHAHRSEIRLFHDVLKELYHFFFQQKLSHFTLLRFWKDASKCKNAKEFLAKNYCGGYGFDHKSDIRQQLLAVNLSLFSNRSLSGECTFSYFLWDCSICNLGSQSYLNDLFNRLGININYINELIKLVPRLKSSKKGQLLQIFIPKSTVDNYVYPSHAFGVPHGPIAAAHANIAFDASLKRHNSIVPILESYLNNPLEMDDTTYDRLQARIVLNDALFNPASNVKIHRYSTIAKEQINGYKTQLREIMARALGEWCTKYANTKTLPTDLQGTAIDILLSKA